MAARAQGRGVAQRTRARGAAMVEFALVVMLFLVLVLGGFEFARMLLEWGRTVEATREGVRTAVVTDPPSGCSLANLECPGGTPVSCAADADSTLARNMQRRQPLIEPENIHVTYACSDTGMAESPSPVPVVTVRVEGLTYAPILPGLLGLEAGIPIPEFPSSQTGESLADLRGGS